MSWDWFIFLDLPSFNPSSLRFRIVVAYAVCGTFCVRKTQHPGDFYSPLRNVLERR